MTLSEEERARHNRIVSNVINARMIFESAEFQADLTPEELVTARTCQELMERSIRPVVERLEKDAKEVAAQESPEPDEGPDVVMHPKLQAIWDGAARHYGSEAALCAAFLRADREDEE